MKRDNRHTHYPNMDIVRYVLSLAVIFAHIGFLTRSRIPFALSSYDAVGGFFALSGFLMHGSYVKHHDFRRYTAQRAPSDVGSGARKERNREGGARSISIAAWWAKSF